MRDSTPIAKDLVLLGGGHSHAIVLRMLGMKPLSGVRVTLLTEDSDTPYSGMVPGHVAGFYSHEECHIDLRRLAEFAGAQLYIDRAIGLDLATNQVICAHRPPVAFDWLSIDIGSTPKLPDVLGIRDAVIPAKPVRRFLEQWNGLLEQIAQHPEQPVTIGIVGGGAGGVELALTMQHRIQEILRQANQPVSNLTLHLFQREATILPRNSRWVRDRLHQRLTQRGVQLHLKESVVSVDKKRVRCESGLEVGCDAVIWVTQASAPDWIGKAGLAVDADGFALVEDTLRSSSHPHIFAAGDIATMIHHPRPKAGVFAVRQGKPLFENLRRSLQGKDLKPFHPQKDYLSLIGTGDGSAIATRGSWGWEAPWLWTLKDWIDRRFMERFHKLPEMKEHRREKEEGGRLPAQPQGFPVMHCAGCGAKVGSGVLNRALQRIQQEFAAPLPSIQVGLETPDDAAVLNLPADRALIQTVDFFPALLDDPFVFGQIATNHALSDLFAMGAEAHSALAIATIPYALEAKAEETLYQLLSGAVKGLHGVGATLIGGHTTEGAELAFGLACNGLAIDGRVLTKGGLQPGQRLILTKAIGTGTLFAAHRQRRAKGRWIDGAIAMMLQSNQAAAQIFRRYGATACTDVTGFGLLGHLVEMVRASEPVAIALLLQSIPLLEGAQETTAGAIVSSLYPQNAQAAQFIQNRAAVENLPAFPLLFDPQTSGGLLAAIAESEASACLEALRAAGYRESTIVGRVIPATSASKFVTIAAE